MTEVALLHFGETWVGQEQRKGKGAKSKGQLRWGQGQLRWQLRWGQRSKKGTQLGG